MVFKTHGMPPRVDTVKSEDHVLMNVSLHVRRLFCKNMLVSILSDIADIINFIVVV